MTASAHTAELKLDLASYGCGLLLSVVSLLPNPGVWGLMWVLPGLGLTLNHLLLLLATSSQHHQQLLLLLLPSPSRGPSQRPRASPGSLDGR